MSLSYWETVVIDLYSGKFGATPRRGGSRGSRRLLVWSAHLDGNTADMLIHGQLFQRVVAKLEELLIFRVKVRSLVDVIILQDAW